jgi:hypothetical protein
MKVEVKDAIRKLGFEITKEDVLSAIPLDKSHCVIHNAIQNSLPFVTEIEVGARVTVLTTRDSRSGSQIKMRYHTPDVLKNGLNTFDKTGNWDLKPGAYYLLPPSNCERLATIAAARANRGKIKKEPKQWPAGRPKAPLNPRYIAFFQQRQTA